MDYITINFIDTDCDTIFKNQTRPITNSVAAQKFGKGDYINEFRPSGAREIRNARMSSIGWQSGLIDILIKDQKCFQV